MRWLPASHAAGDPVGSARKADCNGRIRLFHSPRSPALLEAERIARLEDDYVPQLPMKLATICEIDRFPRDRWGILAGEACNYSFTAPAKPHCCSGLFTPLTQSSIPECRGHRARKRPERRLPFARPSSVAAGEDETVSPGGPMSPRVALCCLVAHPAVPPPAKSARRS